MRKKFGKVLMTLVAVFTLLLSSTLPVSAASINKAAPSAMQQTAINRLLSSPAHINKVKEAQKSIVVPTLSPGQVVEKTINIDNMKYVFTFGNRQIATPLSDSILNNITLNNITPLTVWQGMTYSQIDVYDYLNFWVFSIGYNNDFSYNGSTVNAGQPYITSSKAWWLVTCTVTPQNMAVNNFGSYATSSGTAAVHELDIQVGSIFNYNLYGHATMYGNGTSNSSIHF